MSLAARLLAVLVAVTVVHAVPGQVPKRMPDHGEDSGGDLGRPDPRHLRDFARAKFEASQGDARTRMLGMRDAAAGQMEARLKEYLAGRGTLDFLLESFLLSQQAELLLRAGAADPLALAELAWEQAREAEVINQARFDAGRIPFQDLGDARCSRIAAELAWHRLRAENKAKPDASRLRSRIPESEDPIGAAVFALRHARAKFAATASDPRDLVRLQVEAARMTFDARFKDFLAGRGTAPAALEVPPRLPDGGLGLDDAPSRGTVPSLTQVSRRVLDAERDRYPEPGDQAILFERYWFRQRVIEAVLQARYKSGRSSWWDYQASSADRQEAELWLIEARKRAGKSPTHLSAADTGLPPLPDWLFSDRVLARMKREAFLDDPRQLTRDRLTAAHAAAAGRFHDFNAGRGTLDFLLAATRTWLDAGQSVTDDPAAKQAALERYWTVLWQIERLDEGRYDSGRIPIQDLLQGRYYRLEAELWLAQARAKQKR